MAAQQSTTRQSTHANKNAKATSKDRITKSSPHPPKIRLRRRNGLLNTAIPLRSELMEIAKHNSLTSPLLRLPGELRSKIWAHALGHHHISIALSHYNISIPGSQQVWPSPSIYDIHTLYPCTPVSPSSTRPTFHLPLVCRQIYTEAAPYIYTLNTFAFPHLAAFDRWIKHRCAGQRRLVASLDVPRVYMRLYRAGLRKEFCRKFPNVRRLGVDNETVFCEFARRRRVLGDGGRVAGEMWREAQKEIVRQIEGKEGSKVVVEWCGNSS